MLLVVFNILFLLFIAFLIWIFYKKLQKVIEFQLSLAEEMSALHHVVQLDINKIVESNKDQFAGVSNMIGQLANSSSSLNSVIDSVLDLIRESRDEVVYSDKPMMKVVKEGKEIFVEVDGEF